jgi:uncharacterized cupin superfamily protein
LYLLEGKLEIRHADKEHTLEPGDGVYFDASTPHGYRCGGKTPAIALIVTMHQQQSAQSGVHLRQPIDIAERARRQASEPITSSKRVLVPSRPKEGAEARRGDL